MNNMIRRIVEAVLFTKYYSKVFVDMHEEEVRDEGDC